MPFAFGLNLHERLGLGAVLRARAGARRPPQLPAARARARRVELAQRDDLHPRQPGRLRRVGGAGPDGWGYEDVLPYFKRAEDNERGANRCHGVGGPLAVSESRSMHPIVEAFVEAASRPASRATTTSTARRRRGPAGTRSPSATAGAAATAVAYLHPAVRSAATSTVLTDLRVHRILFEGARAVGVEASAQRAARDDPRRARGDPLRRRLPLAAAADAVRRRARGRPRADAGRVLPTTCRSATTCRTTCMPSFVVFTDEGSLISRRDAGGARAVRGRGPRADHLQRRRRRRVRPHPRRPRRPRRPVPHGRRDAVARGVPRRAVRRRPTLRPGAS